MTKDEIPKIGTQVEIIYEINELIGVIYGTPYLFRNYWCVPFLRQEEEIEDLLFLRIDLIKSIKIKNG